MDRGLAITSFRKGEHHGQSAPCLPTPFLSLSHTHIWTHTAPPFQTLTPPVPQSPWIHPLNGGLLVSGPDRVVNTEILDSPWHVHRMYMGIRKHGCCWHGKAHKKASQSHPHIPFHTAGVYGSGRRSANFNCRAVIIVLLLLLALLFSHIL